MRQRPYGTEILCKHAVDEGLRLIRLSLHIIDISFYSLSVGMKVVMRFDVNVKELEASLNIKKLVIKKKPYSKSSYLHYAEEERVDAKLLDLLWPCCINTYGDLLSHGSDAEISLCAAAQAPGVRRIFAK